MEPIRESRVKESFRIKNEVYAQNREQQLRKELSHRLYEKEQELAERQKHYYSLGSSPEPPKSFLFYFCVIFFGTYLGGAFLSGFLFPENLKARGDGLGIFIIIGLIAAVVYPVIRKIIYSSQENEFSNKCKIESERAKNEKEKFREQIIAEYEEKIRLAYEEAEQLTREQMSSYDRDVSRYYKQYSAHYKQNPAAMEKMCGYISGILEERIHEGVKDAANYRRFIEAEIVFEVTSRCISIADGDAMEFEKARIRELPSEISVHEAVAALIAGKLNGYVKGRYGNRQGKLSIRHDDAKVTACFTMPNPNYVVAD